MKIVLKKESILKAEADLRVLPLKTGEDLRSGIFKQILNDRDRQKITDNNIEKVGASLLISRENHQWLIVGIGEEFDTFAVQDYVGAAYSQAEAIKAQTIAMTFPRLNDDKQVLTAFIQALRLAGYRFEQFKTVNGKTHVQEVCIIVDDGRLASRFAKHLEKQEKVMEGVNIARDLVNTPANNMTPSILAEKAQEIAKASKQMRVRILEKEDCEKKEMGAYLAVAQGSDEAPKFIHLVYKGKKAKKKIVLVGKGITFDSGGLSIKPSKSMETMKCDMAGSAVVLGVFKALSNIEPVNVEVHGIIAAAENMPSSKAIRPGDIVAASNKKTIEILNTDAEGRLTMADALVFGSKLKPDFMIDFATLTGSAVVALGEEIAAVMSSDAKLANKILMSASSVGERMWELPLEEKYRNLLESDVADLRNISKSRYGGTLTAGLFLKEFVGENIKWAHVDIAGPAFAERPFGSYIGKGGTGFSVRTIMDLLLNV